LCEHHTPNPGPNQCLAAWAGQTGVVARLQIHHRSAAYRIPTSVGQSGDLGVGCTRSAVEAFADDPAIAGQDHATDARVRSHDGRAG
jgi:hypothetical protein